MLPRKADEDAKASHEGVDERIGVVVRKLGVGKLVEGEYEGERIRRERQRLGVESGEMSDVGAG